MRTGTWLGISGAGFLVFVASAISVVGQNSWLDPADKVSSVTGGLVGVVSLVFAIRSGRPDPVTQLSHATEKLARLVDRQWCREAGIRGLLHPEPLRVTWLSTTRPVNPPAAEVLDSRPGVTPTRLRLTDNVRNVASTWERLPFRQLVVIGAPGAGKTSLALLLVRQLLARRKKGAPVPVLVNLLGWDPVRVHLDVWLAQRLAADYPELNAKRHYGSGAARRLVNRRLVLPVLDGLDEMPESARPQAIAALTALIGGERPLVLTCRADEYEAAIASVGTPLARAAVVELESVSRAEVGAYLTTGLVDGDQRWAGVIARLRAEPHGALATALSTPLMAYLARIAYREPGTDPGSLLAIADAADIERELLSAYLPTMYRPVPRERGAPKLRKYRPEQAQRWLGALAQQMARRGDGSLTLWSLRSIAGLPRAAVVRMALLVAIAMLPLAQLATGIWFGSVGKVLLILAVVVVYPLGLLVFVLLVSLLSVNSNVMPFRFEPHPGGAIRGVAVGVLAGWVLGAASLVLKDVRFVGRSDLATMLQEVFVTPYVACLAVVGTISGVLLSPVSSSEVLEPSAALRRDSGAQSLVAVISMVSLPATQLMSNEINWFALIGLGILGFPFGWLVSLVLGVGVASTRWYVVRAVLVFAGVLPLRATAFINDAHERGVLRVVGTEYQFRHAKIQAHLAGH